MSLNILETIVENTILNTNKKTLYKVSINHLYEERKKDNFVLTIYNSDFSNDNWGITKKVIEIFKQEFDKLKNDFHISGLEYESEDESDTVIINIIKK